MLILGIWLEIEKKNSQIIFINLRSSIKPRSAPDPTKYIYIVDNTNFGQTEKLMTSNF